jgi:hypothetical protein
MVVDAEAAAPPGTPAQAEKKTGVKRAPSPTVVPAAGKEEPIPATPSSGVKRERRDVAAIRLKLETDFVAKVAAAKKDAQGLLLPLRRPRPEPLTRLIAFILLHLDRTHSERGRLRTHRVEEQQEGGGQPAGGLCPSHMACVHLCFDPLAKGCNQALGKASVEQRQQLAAHRGAP